MFYNKKINTAGSWQLRYANYLMTGISMNMAHIMEDLTEEISKQLQQIRFLWNTITIKFIWKAVKYNSVLNDRNRCPRSTLVCWDSLSTKCWWWRRRIWEFMGAVSDNSHRVWKNWLANSKSWRILVCKMYLTLDFQLFLAVKKIGAWPFALWQSSDT